MKQARSPGPADRAFSVNNNGARNNMSVASFAPCETETFMTASGGNVEMRLQDARAKEMCE